MVYFFHHYELPAILQQARVQQLIARSGSGASNAETNNGADSPAQGDATPPHDTDDNTPQGGQPGGLGQGHVANGRIVTEVNNAMVENGNLLQNHIDQGLLNEIFEGVDDVRVNGLNIDQQLLHNLEEEIQVIQMNHNRAVQDSALPDSGSNLQDLPDSGGTESSIRSGGSPVQTSSQSVNMMDTPQSVIQQSEDLNSASVGSVLSSTCDTHSQPSSVDPGAGQGGGRVGVGVMSSAIGGGQGGDSQSTVRYRGANSEMTGNSDGTEV